VHLGLEELLANHGPVIIEWADRISDVFPADRLWIRLRWVDDLRRGPRIEAATSEDLSEASYF